MQIGEICNREVVIADRDTTILEAAKLMRAEHVGDLIVTDQRNGRQMPVGILTDRDIVVELLAADIELDKITIGDAMSFELVSVTQESGVQEAIEKLRHHGVRRLPVVDAEGALVGIVTGDDLIELLAEQLTGLARLVGKELAGEQRRRQ